MILPLRPDRCANDRPASRSPSESIEKRSRRTLPKRAHASLATFENVVPYLSAYFDDRIIIQRFFQLRFSRVPKAGEKIAGEKIAGRGYDGRDHRGIACIPRKRVSADKRSKILDNMV